MPPLTPSPLTAQCSTVRLRLQQHPSTPSSASDLTRDPTPEIVDRLLQCKAWDVGARMVGQMNHKGEWGCVLELAGRRIPCSDGRWIAEAKTLALQLEATPVAPLTAGLSLRAPTTRRRLSRTCGTTGSCSRPAGRLLIWTEGQTIRSTRQIGGGPGRGHAR